MIACSDPPLVLCKETSDGAPDLVDIRERTTASEEKLLVVWHGLWFVGHVCLFLGHEAGYIQGLQRMLFQLQGIDDIDGLFLSRS